MKHRWLEMFHDFQSEIHHTKYRSTVILHGGIHLQSDFLLQILWQLAVCCQRFATRMLSECWFNRPGREAAQTKSMEELAVGSSWRFVDSKTTETTSSHRTKPNVKILGSTKHILYIYIYQIVLHVRTI